ncbi:MAG: DEAD/DEAH box helicase [Propionicimonas sp.]|uniref:DEAD/DEAH box helicase n=1 Tax=Propionicimonas sp. TaxID=1955623 RepID=UPI002B218DB7|nr:DEAD/DEAH box helicase [Propionicimonas sp.]MEA4945817.1 DEAD/DEAH box helicase [Propionicimonas sp.]MEA5054299.1 DEAD/DEAH box helicase [Propionicimonas sp.]MEA5119068.1 DEAD/DEAH box helicase [Propionicimonas sp.]
MALPEWMQDDPRLCHVHHRPACDGVPADWPEWVGPQLREAAARLGIERPWSHQVAAAEAAFAGSHVALATPTASGKTLAYLLPVLAATLEGRLAHQHLPVPGPLRADPGRSRLAPAGNQRVFLDEAPHTALYLAPTKALAHDQWRSCRELELPGFRVSTLDGDSDEPERRFARDFACYVLTNPDMLHRSVLPNHARFARLLGNLRYVVVDEAHRYRGIFGAQVSAVLRRLRRLARHYGADPVFITSSATMADPAGHLIALTGVDQAVAVETDGSRRPALDFCLWQPAEDAHAEAAELMARLIGDGRQTLTFTTSRVQAELVALRAQKLVTDPGSVASYRAGYLAGDRRALERALADGSLRGVASTDALELGVDIAGMDAVISCGFPGTLASLWQQAGRAGRDGRDALAVLVAKPEPLDAYLCTHPELVFDRPVERTVLHPWLPAVLGPHLAAAAQELPLTEADTVWFGPTTVRLAERLAADGVLRRRAAGWYWTRPERAVDAIDLRSLGAGSVDIVDAGTGRVIGQVDPNAADRTVHTGAIYLHQGEQWLVTDYDSEARSALVTPCSDPFFTQAVGVSDLRVLTDERQWRLPGAVVHLGAVELSSQVTGYLRRDEVTGKVWDSTPLESPVRSLQTRAVWWTLDDSALTATGIDPKALPGAAHAAEHAAIGLLPAFAPCDRWDIGGLSTALHPDTGRPTIFVHEGQPGGAGFSERAFDAISDWLAATLDQLRDCPCEAGCPRCVVSPKCGNGNQPLDKQAAITLLAVALGVAQPATTAA